MRQFPNGSRSWFNVFFANALHNPLDVLLNKGFFLHQHRMKVVSLTLPLSIQSVPNVVWKHSQNGPIFSD